MPNHYAGIGSRETPSKIIWLMKAIGYLLGKAGEICKTGACIGADQNFAEGAMRSGGEVILYLPWAAYEEEWVSKYDSKAIVRWLAPRMHTAAMESVSKFHPTPKKLTQAVVKLHARNYLIIQGCSFVVCWTPNGAETGGTGQGIRIANSMRIPVYNLGNESTYNDFHTAIRDRVNELPIDL